MFWYPSFFRKEHPQVPLETSSGRHLSFLCPTDFWCQRFLISRLSSLKRKVWIILSHLHKSGEKDHEETPTLKQKERKTTASLELSLSSLSLKGTRINYSSLKIKQYFTHI